MHGAQRPAPHAARSVPRFTPPAPAAGMFATPCTYSDSMIAKLILALLLASPGGAPGPQPDGAPRPPPGVPLVTADVPVSLYVPLTDLVRHLTLLFGDRSLASAVRATALPGGRMLRLTGSAVLIERVRRLVTRPPCASDRPGPPVSVIPLRYQKAETIRRRLVGTLLAGAQILADPPTNSLIVVAAPDLASKVRAQVKRLDVPPARVKHRPAATRKSPSGRP